MSLRVVPCTIAQAKAWVLALHRHLPDLTGGLFAAAIVDEEGHRHGVAVAGRPPPEWEGTGRIVISRVATDGAHNACSMLYGALCRAAKALGYTEAWTYTLKDEPGTSLRAAGFEDMGWTDGRDRDTRAGRRRCNGPKRRWRRVLRG